MVQVITQTFNWISFRGGDRKILVEAISRCFMLSFRLDGFS